MDDRVERVGCYASVNRVFGHTYQCPFRNFVTVAYVRKRTQQDRSRPVRAAMWQHARSRSTVFDALCESSQANSRRRISVQEDVCTAVSCYPAYSPSKNWKHHANLDNFGNAFSRSEIANKSLYNMTLLPALFL